jgi:hypothetical protein
VLGVLAAALPEIMLRAILVPTVAPRATSRRAAWYALTVNTGTGVGVGLCAGVGSGAASGSGSEAPDAAVVPEPAFFGVGVPGLMMGATELARLPASMLL